MNSPFVFVTRHIPENGIKLLKEAGYEVKIGSKTRNLSIKEIAKQGKGADALLCLLTDKIDGNVLDALGPQLKIIANYAVGHDNINLEAAKERGIAVTNTPGATTGIVAEHTVALILGLTR